MISENRKTYILIDLRIIITHTAGLLSLLSDFKKSESRIKLALTSMSDSKEVKAGYKI